MKTFLKVVLFLIGLNALGLLLASLLFSTMSSSETGDYSRPITILALIWVGALVFDIYKIKKSEGDSENYIRRRNKLLYWWVIITAVGALLYYTGIFS